LNRVVNRTELDWVLPAFDWRTRVTVLGLPPEYVPFAQRRWPTAGAPPPFSLTLEVNADAVGLEPSLRVHTVVTWKDADTALVRTNGAEVEVCFASNALRGTGVLRDGACVGALEAVFRSVAILWLVRRGVLVIHASAVRRGDDGLLFLGASGAGKTTTARRLGREGFRRIADDAVAIDVSDRSWRMIPLPFERGGRPPLVEAAPATCRGAALVLKSASVLTIQPADDGPQGWRDALVAFSPGPGRTAAHLEHFATLCALPVARLAAPPFGRLGDAVAAWLEQLLATRRHLDKGPLLGKHGAMASHEGAPPPDRVLRRAPNVAWRVIDGAAVVVAPHSPTIQTLNPVATRIWELVDGYALAAIVDTIVNEFDVTRTQAEHDVVQFVSDLERSGLLETGGATQP
jgi:hypothetical protein